MLEEMTKEDFQSISYDFRNLSSRLLTSDYRYAEDNLLRFVTFIDETPLVRAFIDKHNVQSFDMEGILKSRDYYDVLDIPTDQSGEISFVYQLMKYILENKPQYTWYARGYATGRNVKYQTLVDEFHKCVFNPFIMHIISYFEKEMIMLGMKNKDNAKVVINGPNNGQFNISNDSSTINATMNVNPKITEINDLINQFRSRLKSEEIDYDHREEFDELTEVLQSEVKETKPKKSLIKMAISRIRELITLAKLSVVAGEEITEVVEMVQEFIV